MSNSTKTGLNDNTIGALAYFTPAPAIFFLAVRRYNKRPYVRFHAWQSLVFSAFVFLFAYALVFALQLAAQFGVHFYMGLRWLVIPFWIAVLLVWLWCVIGALSGKNCKLPVLGKWADEQAYR